MNIRELVDINADGTYTTLFDGKARKGFKYPNGYIMIEFRHKGVKYREYAHILVAEKFVPGRQDTFEVHHKDGNKSNPVATNLQWISHQGNVAHGNATLRDASKTFKAVIQYDMSGTIIAKHESVKAAAIALGKDPRSPLICYACKGSCSTNTCNTAYGYKWSYAE